jgi:hypothetical protein
VERSLNRSLLFVAGSETTLERTVAATGIWLPFLLTFSSFKLLVLGVSYFTSFENVPVTLVVLKTTVGVVIVLVRLVGR